MFCCTYIFGIQRKNILSTKGFRQLVMLLIFILKRTRDIILSWGFPFSSFWMFDSVEPIRTRNFLFECKALIKVGSLPFNPKLWRSLMIPNLQVVPYALSMSQNIATRCCFCIIASRMEVSNLTTWSIVDLRLLKPHWKLVKISLDSIKQIVLHWPFIPWSYTDSF